MDNRFDSKNVAMRKRRKSPDQSKSGVDLHDMLNAKRNQEGDLCDKLNDRKVAVVSKVIPAGSVVCTVRNE